MTKSIINIKFQKERMAKKVVRNGFSDGLSLNPFTNVWTKPRETLQAILNFNPNYLVLLLSAIYGLKQGLDISALSVLGDNYPLWAILLGVIILGPIIGIASLYLGSWLLVWTGKWIQGQSSYQTMRTALAWSYVPSLINLGLIIITLPFFGIEVFTSTTPSLYASNSLLVLLIVISSLDLLLSIWMFVISIIMISEAQQFSVWKALGNILLAMLVVLVPLFIILTIYFFIVPVSVSLL